MSESSSESEVEGIRISAKKRLEGRKTRSEQSRENVDSWKYGILVDQVSERTTAMDHSICLFLDQLVHVRGVQIRRCSVPGFDKDTQLYLLTSKLANNSGRSHSIDHLPTSRILVPLLHRSYHRDHWNLHCVHLHLIMLLCNLNQCDDHCTWCISR